MKKQYLDSSLDEYLEEEGLLAHVEEVALALGVRLPVSLD